MERSKAESFTVYLKEKQRLERATAPATGGTAMSILAALAGGSHMALTELQSASGMSFADFAEAIQRLQNSGYLILSGDPGREVAELTRLGEDVAQLARPV